jgi:hypothetical protein
VDAERLLLDEGVVAHRVELEVGRQRDRPQRAVQCQRDVIGSAMAAILRVSVMPPACEGSGWMMST